MMQVAKCARPVKHVQFDNLKFNSKIFFNFFQALPHPTYFHSAAVTKEGCMYIFGGIERIGEDRDERTNNVFKMWLVIPTLERLSWEALCDAIPHDRRLDTSRLGSLCVPKYLLTSYDAQFQVGLPNDPL